MKDPDPRAFITRGLGSLYFELVPSLVRGRRIVRITVDDDHLYMEVKDLAEIVNDLVAEDERLERQKDGA